MMRKQREMNMKYKIFQINLTDEEIDTINAADDHGARSQERTAYED
jgi:diketogulonate reductase-like aldo/keto reductase